MEINESWALVLNDTFELISHNDLSAIKEIILNTSSQPNSKPHIGTVTTFLFNFAIANHFKSMTGSRAAVCFDELENTPVKEECIDGETYMYYLDEKESECELARNMSAYKKVLDCGRELSGIPYFIRTYREFQSIPTIRRSIIKIIKEFDKYNRYLKFTDINYAVRTKCPCCGLVKRRVDRVEACEDEIIIHSSCIHHGGYSVVVSPDNDTYFSMGMQLRDVTKGVLCTELKPEKLCIMCDSRDWGGEWNNIFHCMTKQLLGYNQITERIFTPLIVDSTGRKVSKTIHVRGGYSELKDKEIFLDFDHFFAAYGFWGVQKIYNEVEKWARIPKKAVRNYSLEYVENLFECSE